MNSNVFHHPFRRIIFPVHVTRKTGTAELKQEKGTQGKENGLFVAYPADRRDLLLALLIEGVENDGGSRYAVNTAKRIFTSFR
ncbi:penicillin-binding transpeptidase domain-containing protein [Geobacillus sp. BK01]|uniref:penicillin-binding transpeptidase domain-containing protein n=1 Tax=Geobacillus sp. BK01 TaxID=3457328 RepID=UPI003FA6103F